MGTLADVTDRANNTPRNSSSRRGTPRSPPKPKMNVSTPKDRGYKENPPPPGFVHPFKAMVEGIPETPRYLTPTNSSRSQAGTRKQGQGWPGSSTPTTSLTPSSTLKGPRWVASAARRVGLSRIPGDTPKSKTALPHGHQNVKTDGKTVEVVTHPVWYLESSNPSNTAESYGHSSLSDTIKSLARDTRQALANRQAIA
jgi:hypothetical protein